MPIIKASSNQNFSQKTGVTGFSIQVNGDVVPCGRDPKGEMVMGNLLKEDLDSIWNGRNYIDFRK
tara:strand:+ start:360 stop:554 length:195 start_codon:yes stop_codon:yes gene_type:complete